MSTATAEIRTDKALTRNVGVTVLARLGYMASRVAIPPFVMAHMSLQEYGIWTSAFILVAYLGVSTMGLSNVYIRYVAKYNAEGNYRRANELVSTGLFISVPLCALLFVGLTYFWPALAHMVKLPAQLAGGTKEAVYLVVLIFLSSISLCAFQDVLNGVQRIDVVQKIWVAGYLIETALTFALVAAGRGIRGMAEAFFLKTVVSIFLSVYFAYRLVPWLHVSPRLVSRASLRELLSFGSVVQIQCFLDVVLNSIERVLALMFAGFEMAGLLDISKKMPTSIATIPLAYAGAFLPAASHLEASSSERERARLTRELYLSGARQMNLSAAYFCGFLACLALPILDVWLGKRLPGTGILLTVFAISMQVHLLTGPGTSISKGIGRPQEEFYYCVPNLLLLFLTVPVARYIFGGYTSTAIGLAAASATICSATYFLLRMNRQLGIRHREYFGAVILPGLAPYAIAAPLFAMIGHRGLIDTSRLAGAAILMVAGCLYTVSFAAVVYTRLLEPEQRTQIRAFIGKVWGTPRPAVLTETVDCVVTE